MIMKYLLTLLMVMLFSCSSEESTSFRESDNPGWSNIGSLEQPIIRRAFDVTPANDVYDFNNATQLDFDGPFLVGAMGWVVDDDPTAGALIMDMNYADPTGTVRIVNFLSSLILNLNDPTSFFTTPAVFMRRETGSSLWELAVSLAGLAGTSTVHYEVLVTPNQATDNAFFSDQP